MTFAVVSTVRSSLAARLDMAIPSLKSISNYTPGTGASLRQRRLLNSCIQGIAVTKKRAGLPRHAVAHPIGDWIRIRVMSRRRHQDGVDHVDHAVRLIDVWDRDGR